MSDLVDVILDVWNGVLSTKIAEKYKIGVDIFPTPQTMGNLLHEMIPILLYEKYPEQWRRDIVKNGKDLVCIANQKFSTEIKASSNKYTIFGNASYGKEDSSEKEKKNKDGYMLAIDFEKLTSNDPSFTPKITKIRMGWLDYEDWHSQKSTSGQQAKISAETRKKLLVIYDYKKGGKKCISYKKTNIAI